MLLHIPGVVLLIESTCEQQMHIDLLEVDAYGL